MESWLKIDFHTHTAEDPYDSITYNARQLILKASQKGYDALAVTNHDILISDNKISDYAEEKGILLIPGMEANISNKHVLIINPGFPKNVKSNRFSDLETIKSSDNLIIAPHPYFPGSSSLGNDLDQNIFLFDAIEYSQYYNRFIDFNKKAVAVAHKHKLPLIGSSDCHCIWQFGQAYSFVLAEKNITSIIRAVKEGKTKPHSPPLSLYNFYRSGLLFIRTRWFGSKRKKIRSEI
jgi:predicted metal-dependent phosphoesterase TrpH